MRTALSPALLLALAGCATTSTPDSDGIARAGLDQRVYVDGPWVTPLAVVEDSRCPVGVQCISAGRTRVMVRIDLGSRSEYRELCSDKPLQVADGAVAGRGHASARSRGRARRLSLRYAVRGRDLGTQRSRRAVWPGSPEQCYAAVRQTGRRALRRWAVIVAMSGAFCAALPAMAQNEPAQPPAESDTTIVVTGEKDKPPSRAEITEQAQELSRVGRYQVYDEALPRFEAPLCPGVFGLRDDYAAEIGERIRANAARLDVEVAGRGCSPNLFIAFVEDGQKVVADLATAHPGVFCIVGESEQEEILRDGEPVRVWSHIRTIDIRRTGAPVRIRQCREDIPSPVSKVGMFLSERRDIVSSLVVFDHEAALGMTLVQLADYATMRGLSHTRPASGNERMETILALFEGDRSSPSELTEFDVGYLESLYHWRPDQRAMTRFLSIGRRAEREAEAREAAD